MINCLIIDDEPLARDLLKGYVDDVEGLHCVGVCKNAIEAFSFLHDHRVDLMFLDINMPEITGLNFLKSLKNPPAVIFTTAYAEYAVEAFELSAVDYLLKPITPERFLKSVQKIMSLNMEAPTQQKSEATSLFLKVDKRLVKINFKDIIYVEALGDYVKVFTDKETLVTLTPISKIEALLPTDQFLRIHRSFIASLAYIKFLEGNALKVGEYVLPIGATYRDMVLKKMR